MKKTTFLALSLLLFSTPGLGQNNNDRPKLLMSFGPQNEDALNAIYNLGGQLTEENFNPQEEILVIRVCSNDPLPIALAMANSSPFIATQKLGKRGIPDTSIFYLRHSNDCKPIPDNYVSTDFWLVPKNAEFPEFVEARRASTLSGRQLIRGDELADEGPLEVRSRPFENLTPQAFKLVLIKLATLMKNNKSAFVVIHVPFFKRFSTVELNKNVAITLKYLKANGISSHRIYVRKIYSGRTVALEDAPKYPDILFVGED